MNRAVGEFWSRLAAGVLALAVAGAAWPCGFEDPASVALQRGTMNFAFPKSAYVLTAIWQAQMTGELPRDKLTHGPATLQLVRATWLLKSLATRLGAATDVPDHPIVAVVLLSPMLWTRLESRAGNLVAQVHVNGPEPGDVVLVTDTPVIEAIVEGGMSFEHAIELGLVRLYGPPARVGVLQSWLVST